MRLFCLLILALALPGCAAQIAADIVTAPIKVASKTVDVLTTSQEEADRNRGREARKAEERAKKEAKKERKRAKKAEKESQDWDD
jgi:predicted Holliday junction resolvase-like endonuclease